MKVENLNLSPRECRNKDRVSNAQVINGRRSKFKQMLRKTTGVKNIFNSFFSTYFIEFYNPLQCYITKNKGMQTVDKRSQCAKEEKKTNSNLSNFTHLFLRATLNPEEPAGYKDNSCDAVFFQNISIFYFYFHPDQLYENSFSCS